MQIDRVGYKKKKRKKNLTILDLDVSAIGVCEQTRLASMCDLLIVVIRFTAVP